MGGLDLCFGRWDSPQHVLTDDPEDTEFIWPGTCIPFAAHCYKAHMSYAGKDYSNPRVMDFHTLSKPHEDMYDRAKVPRMPW